MCQKFVCWELGCQCHSVEKGAFERWLGHGDCPSELISPSETGGALWSGFLIKVDSVLLCDASSTFCWGKTLGRCLRWVLLVLRAMSQTLFFMNP